MKYVEQAGLVKFDFLGLTTLTILKRACAFLAAPRDRGRSRAPAARRSGHLRDAEPRRCERGVPVRRAGHARRAAPDAPRPVRGPDRRHRALPAGPDGEHPRLLSSASTARNGRRRIRCLREHPGRDLRHHRLPGAGDADRPDPGRLQPGRAPICCAAPWARRSSSEMDEPAPGLQRRRGRARHSTPAQGGARSSI